MDPFERFFAKFMFVIGVIAMICYIYDVQTTQVTDYSGYEWDTPEDRLKRENAAERKWMKENGIDSMPVRDPIPHSSDQTSSLENADPESSLFRDYMEELDDRGIELGSPRAQEIWETYYK